MKEEVILMLVSDSEADFIRGMTTLGSHSRVERLGLTPKTTWKHGDSESRSKVRESVDGKLLKCRVILC